MCRVHNVFRELCLIMKYVLFCLKATRIDGRTYTLIKYLTDLSLMDYSMACINPSQIAAASFCLAMKIYGISNWVSLTITTGNYKSYISGSILGVASVLVYPYVPI